VKGSSRSPRLAIRLVPCRDHGRIRPAVSTATIIRKPSHFGCITQSLPAGHERAEVLNIGSGAAMYEA